MSLIDANSSVDGNHSAMIEVLCKQRSGLNVVHFNARSLNGLKLDYVRSIFENSSVDVICVTETWYRNEVSENIYRINGYNMFLNSRKDKIGGGVAIYCKHNLKAKLVSKSCDAPVEYINIMVGDNIKSVLVSCVYNPYKQFSLEPYFSELSRYAIAYDCYIACGDFNVNLLNEDRHSNELRDHVSALGFTIINNDVPTRFSPNCNPSLLDLFLLSDRSLLLLFDQISFISDHDLLFCSVNVCLNRDSSPRLVTFRDFNSIDYPMLHSALSETDFTDCWYQPTVDGKLDALLLAIQNIFNMHVPLRSYFVKNCSCPWYTARIRQSIRDCNRAYGNFKKNPSAANRSEYNRARNAKTLMIRQAKKVYFAKKLNTSLPTAQLWKNIKKLGVHSDSTHSCDIGPDELSAAFFVDQIAQVESNSLHPNFYCSSTFEFRFVSEADVYRAIMNIRSNAIGEDGLSIRFLKIIIQFVLGPLTHIFNHCITSSTFPKQWKVGRVIPVAKVSCPRSSNDYRPISILPVLAKVFETLMSKQINEYLDQNHLMSPLQSGFRIAHSCNTAALKVLEDLRPEYDKGNISLMCMLDFSKAFDRVNHYLLLQKLKLYFGFSEAALALMCSFLFERLQKIVVGESESICKEMKVGVPQGSVLGPLLFSMFINDLFNVCNHVRLHGYADDMQMYISNRIGLLEDMCCRLNEDLEIIGKWAENNSLTLNPKKSVVLPISRSKISIEELPAIYLNGNALEYVEKVKYLGFHINSTLSCTDHINSIVRKVFLTLRNLRITSNFTPTNIKRQLVLQLILPHINYSAQLYSKLDSHSMHKLQVAFNNATRYVYCLSRYSSVSSWRKMILGCDLIDYLRLRNLLFMHNLLHQKTPMYLYEKLDLGRTARFTTLIIPRYSYLNTSRFFFINAARLWNSLPIHIKRMSGKNSFKKAVLELITSNN